MKIMIFIKYLGLEYKRALYVISRMIFVIAAIVLVSFAVTFCGMKTMESSKDFCMIRVDIAAQGDHTDIGLISSLLENTDSVKSVCTFETTDMTTAVKGIEDGSVDAAVILGADFYNDVNNGINTPVRIILGNRVPLGSSVFKELARDGVKLVRTTEAAVYASSDTAREYSMDVDIDQLQNAVTDIFISSEMNRAVMFDNVVMSSFGEVNLREYYSSSFLTSLILFMGLCFGYMYRRDSTAFEDRLRMYGIRSAGSSAAKVTVMTTILWAVCLIVMAAATVTGASTGYSVYQIIAMLIPSFSIASFFHMIYSMGRRDTHAGMLLFLLDILMTVSSGLIIPVSYLPKAVARIGSVMPLGLWFPGISNILFGRPDAAVLFRMTAAGLACAVAGGIFLWKDI